VAGLAFTASIIGSVIAIYTARFNRFTLEKWWDRKSEAYTRIIEALSDLVDYYEKVRLAELGEIKVSDEKRREIYEKSTQDYRAITKAINMGVFVISEEAEETLRNYRTIEDETFTAGDFIGDVERKHDYAQDCIQKLIKCAKKDLKIR